MRAGINPCDEAKCGPYEQCVINRQGIASCECGVECEPVMRPVCARGGKTYTSLCELKRQACLTRTNIEVAYTGTCGSRGPCSEKVSRRGAEWRVEGTRQIFEYTRRERIKIIARTIIWKSRNGSLNDKSNTFNKGNRSKLCAYMDRVDAFVRRGKESKRFT